jgi:hypothetical protein
MGQFQLPEHVALATKGYKTEPLAPDAYEIALAVEAYKAKWGLPESAQPTAQRWSGILDKDGYIVAVLGQKEIREDGLLEITDFYPLPGVGRRGVLAAYAVLNVIRTMLAVRVVKSVACTTLAANTTFRKAVERVFGVTPTAVVYMAEAA